MKDASYVSKFDWTATYDLESTVPTITVSPHFTAPEYHAATVLPFAEKDGFGESAAIATFVSNCQAAGASSRYGMMEELAKYMPVHNYGKCLKNKDEPKMEGCRDGDRACNKQKVLQRYEWAGGRADGGATGCCGRALTQIFCVRRAGTSSIWPSRTTKSRTT
jgi:hypothetical protein